jgi:hypothetical protein
VAAQYEAGKRAASWLEYCAQEPAVIRIFKHYVPRMGLILLMMGLLILIDTAPVVLSAKGGR